MNRITGRLRDGVAYVTSETGTEGVGHFTTQRRIPEMIARLAAYEDTGLAPNEVATLQRDAGQLRAELEAAKRWADRFREWCPMDRGSVILRDAYDGWRDRCTENGGSE